LNTNKISNSSYHYFFS